MKTKWYFSTLIIILALFGLSLEPISLPNQEIVVQFAHDEVTSEEAQEAVAVVKEQLQVIGANNIQVQEVIGGGLKITYYSEVDVDSIEELFSEEKNLDLGYVAFDHDNEPTEFPSNNTENNYKLNVNEIQKSSDTDSDFDGYVIELRLESDRFFKPYVYNSLNTFDVREINSIQSTAFIAQRNCAMAIDNSSHNIPEVRAGPTTIGVS